MSSIATTISPLITEKESCEFLDNGYSKNAKIIIDKMLQSMAHFSDTVSRENEIPEIKFKNLKFDWKIDTEFMSSINNIVMHPSYQRIIGMGKDATKLILNEMKEEKGHWFWALRAITNEDPVKPSHRGNIEAMTEDWLDWGQENGYL